MNWELGLSQICGSPKETRVIGGRGSEREREAKIR